MLVGDLSWLDRPHDVGVPLVSNTLKTNGCCVFAAVALSPAAAAELVGPEPGVGEMISDIAVVARCTPPGPVPVVTQEEADRPHPPALDQRRRLDLERLLARLWIAVGHCLFFFRPTKRMSPLPMEHTG